MSERELTTTQKVWRWLVFTHYGWSKIAGGIDTHVQLVEADADDLPRARVEGAQAQAVFDDATQEGLEALVVRTAGHFGYSKTNGQTLLEGGLDLQPRRLLDVLGTQDLVGDEVRVPAVLVVRHASWPGNNEQLIVLRLHYIGSTHALD